MAASAINVTGVPKAYLNVKLTKVGGSTIPAKALVDTGNTLQCGVAISTTMAKQLKLSVEGRPIRVGTAARGQQLEARGVAEEMDIQLPGYPAFRTRPLVFPSLSHDCNLGLRFLQEHKMALDYGKSIPVLRSLEGEAQLIATVSNKPVEFNVVLEADQPVPAGQSILAKIKGVPESQEWRFKSSVNHPQVIPVPGSYQGAGVWVKNISQQSVLLRAGKTVGTGQLHLETIARVDTEEQDVLQLIKELKIDENPLLQQHPEVKRNLKQMVHDYRDVFSTDQEKFGSTTLIECDLRLKPGVCPVRQRVRPLNPRMEADLKKQVDEWLAEGLVQPSSSAWATPLVPVRKKTGEIRFCCDYRRLNQATIPDAWPLPRIQETLHKLRGSRFFSSLDAAAAYWTIPMSASSRHFMAIITPFGLFEWMRMPFGLAQAGAVYSRYVCMVLQRVKNVISYMDDILCYSWRMNHHLAILEDTMRAHRDAGLKLKASKSQLFQTSIQFLGHQVSAEGLQMVPIYLEKILNWPTPSTVKELGTLIGFFSYYRSFVKEFSWFTQEMNTQRNLLKLTWTPVMEKKFVKLKKMFAVAPIRAFPNYEDPEPFRLTTDFSG